MSNKRMRKYGHWGSETSLHIYMDEISALYATQKLPIDVRERLFEKGAGEKKGGGGKEGGEGTGNGACEPRSLPPETPPRPCLGRGARARGIRARAVSARASRMSKPPTAARYSALGRPRAPPTTGPMNAKPSASSAGSSMPPFANRNCFALKRGARPRQ